MYDEDDDELLDDPISLINKEFPKNNEQEYSTIYAVEDDVEDDPIILNINPNEKYVDTDIVDLRSSDEENEEQHPTPKSGYGNKNFVIPVTFLDFYRNVKLLKKCKPLSIKVVDCDKHPWYYRHRGARKATVNGNCVTLGKHSNVLTQEIKVEKADESKVTLENEGVNAETLTTTNQSLNDKTQNQGKINSVFSSVSYPVNDVPEPEPEPKTPNTNYEKLENELEIAKKSKDLSQVDFKRNSGLVGLTISQKHLNPNLDKVMKKKTRKKRKKENIESNTAMKDIGVALSNLGTSVTPVPETREDNVLEKLTKDSHANNTTLQDLSFKSSYTSDIVNNNTISPTRCSLKITNPKIFEKVVQLKKANSQDEPKAKPQVKARKIFRKDQAVPKLNLKRRPTTENDEFYVVNSNKKPRSNTMSELSQSQEPQIDENATKNRINQRQLVENCPPVTPLITISVKNQEKVEPKTSMIAEKRDQTQGSPTLPTPRSYHKKLKLKKSTINVTPNKTNQNEPITPVCLKNPNNKSENESDCSHSSGLNKVVVSQVQSLRNMNTLTPNKSNCETPKKAETYHSYKLKRTKNIDTGAANSNLMTVNENVIQNGNTTTHNNKVQNTHILQSPLSYMQVYNAHLLNYYNNLTELSQKTKRKSTSRKRNKPDAKIMKETEKNATEQDQRKRPKDTVTSNNNINVTNNYIPNRDTVSSDVNLNNTLKPPTNFLYIQRFGDQKQLDELFNMKQKQLNTQPNPTDTANNFPPIKTQVYNLPGNIGNTVILRNPPINIQTSTHQTPGLPIQTVVNHRPTNTPKPSPRMSSPWSFPPPNTNVASIIPYCRVPNMHIYSGNPQFYWQPMSSGNQNLPSPPLMVQQERNSNLVLVKNQVPCDSIIGSTANGELIKKINLVGVPASDNTVVNDKQKMLDTLNNAIKERNDFIHAISDPRQTFETNRAKPCPLSKKDKPKPETNVGISILSKKYSPPILPIPSFQKAIELVKMKQKVHNSLISQMENMENSVVNTNSNLDKSGLRSEQDTPNKILTDDNKKHDRTKKISIEEYKKRVSKYGINAKKVSKHKCKIKKLSKAEMADNNKDLGYDSDATMKL